MNKKINKNTVGAVGLGLAAPTYYKLKDRVKEHKHEKEKKELTTKTDNMISDYKWGRLITGLSESKTKLGIGGAIGIGLGIRSNLKYKKNENIRKNDMEKHKEHESVRGHGYLGAYKKLYDKEEKDDSIIRQLV